MTATARHSIDKDGILATRLCTHKEDVNQLNNIHLQKLEGESVVFEAYDSDPELARHMNNQCPVGPRIEIKIGAQVGFRILYCQSFICYSCQLLDEYQYSFTLYIL